MQVRALLNGPCSQLTLVFGILLREGRIEERELEGLSEDKLAHMRLVAFGL
jgi:hypothetical protein